MLVFLKAWIGYLMRYGGLTGMDTLQNSFQIVFKLKKLVCLELRCSHIIQLWKGKKLLDKLKFINLSHSHKLIRTPAFTGIPNLERLILEDCSSLIEIHPSAGHLKRLQLLNSRNRTNLRSLPKRIFLERFEVMILYGCSKVDEFPEILGTMDCPSLTTLFLQATSLKELPPSIFEHLPSLVFLNLSHSKNLTSLPSSIGRLKCLKSLNLCFCSKLDKLPVGLTQLQSLQELYIEENVISKRPCSFELLDGFKFSSLGERIEKASQTWKSQTWTYSYWLEFGDYSRRMYRKGVLVVTPLPESLKSLIIGGHGFNRISAANIHGTETPRTKYRVHCQRSGKGGDLLYRN
ncbi:hypothetical protein ACH5RR_038852 [Cinchona calisaya]|uniref:Disease resistance protein RPS4B/Roq1-like leucine-rich repeats domain-containing protein n=1 Tax=Cinchona calisaya TaxID=153742 RepID=A0ABD2Y231_9GENT